MYARQRLFSALAGLAIVVLPLSAGAATTPDTMTYEGVLLDSEGNARTTAHSFRFSLWNSQDWVLTDTGSGGSINEDAMNFGGWYEFQTVTPTTDGRFSLQLGDAVPLPSPDFAQHKFLQVEIKNAVDPNSAYQLMDPTHDAGADTDDRSVIGSSMYARNAEAVSNRTVGSGSGDILILGPEGRIDPRQMGDGTDLSTFTINTENASDTASLHFGNSLGTATLLYSAERQRFEFSGDVYVDGVINASQSVSAPSLAATSIAGCSVIGTNDDGTLICENWGSISQTLVIRKSVDESISNIDDLQHDDQLKIPVGANETWAFEMNLIGQSSIPAAFKFSIDAPSGSECAFSAHAERKNNASSHIVCGERSNKMRGEDRDSPYTINGNVLTATGGFIRLQWSQFDASSEASIIRAGSWLKAYKIQ